VSLQVAAKTTFFEDAINMISLNDTGNCVMEPGTLTAVQKALTFALCATVALAACHDGPPHLVMKLVAPNLAVLIDHQQKALSPLVQLCLASSLPSHCLWCGTHCPNPARVLHGA